MIEGEFGKEWVISSRIYSMESLSFLLTYSLFESTIPISARGSPTLPNWSIESDHEISILFSDTSDATIFSMYAFLCALLKTTQPITALWWFG